MKLNVLPFLFPDAVGLDIETRSVGETPDPWQDSISTIQIDIPGDDTYVLTKNFEKVTPLLVDPHVMKIAHNFAFDSKFLEHNLGVRILNVFDTFLAERILTAGKQERASLEAVARRRLSVSLKKEIRKLFGRRRDLTDEMLQYAAQDAAVLFPIYQQQVKELEREGLSFVAELENQLSLVVGKMELNGIKFDQKQWECILVEETKLRDEAALLAAKALEVPFHQMGLFGEESYGVNFNSRDSVLHLLKKQGVSLPDYQAKTLETYLRRHPNCESIKHILDYKEHEKRLTWDYPKYINSITGRIHPDINQIGARTGRFAFSNPNLQQVPKLGSFRKLFIAEEGYQLITADYSQIELRILAEITNDKNMIEAFQSGRDFHQATAELIAKELGTEPNRALGKGCNFAVVYGSTAKSRAAATGMPVSTWQTIYKAFFSTYSALEPWYKEAFSSLITKGYTKTISGRKRWFPELNSTNSHKYRNISRNTPIQGSALDIMKLALVYIDKALENYDAKLVHTIHDEVVVEVIDNQKEIVKQVAQKEMIRAGEYFLKQVPVVIDVTGGDYWGAKGESKWETHQKKNDF